MERPDRSSDPEARLAPRQVTAIASLYRRYRPLARRIARRFHPHDPTAVEDVIQDVFLSLCEAQPRLDTSRCLSGWIGRVTTNRCLTLRRRESAAARGAHRAGTNPHLYARPAGVELETRLLERNELARVLVALERLPERQARALRQHGLEGTTQTAIAKALGVTKGYVSRVIKSARLALRRQLDPETTQDTGVAGSKALARPRPRPRPGPPPLPPAASGRHTPRVRGCMRRPAPRRLATRHFAHLDDRSPTRDASVTFVTGGVRPRIPPRFADTRSTAPTPTDPLTNARLDAWSGGTAAGCPLHGPSCGRARPHASSTTPRTSDHRPVIPPAAWGLARPRPPPHHRPPRPCLPRSPPR